MEDKFVEATKLLNGLRDANGDLLQGIADENNVLEWLKYVDKHGMDKAIETFISDLKNNYDI